MGASLDLVAVRRALARPFTVDLRGLACLRVGLGLVVLADLAQRAQWLTAHYNEAGIFPRASVEFVGPSLSFLFGGSTSVALMFGLTAVAAALFMVGFHTRWAGLALWVLVISLQNRNLAVAHAGDTVLRLLLFWSQFLPLSARASFDERDQTRGPNQLLSPGSIALVVQLALVFGCAIDFKLQGRAWVEGYAVRDALSVSFYTRPWAHRLLQFPELLQALTRATELAQAFIPLALVMPWRQPLFRTLAVVTTVGTQIGFGVCMNLGTFPWVMSVFAAALLPSEVFDRFWPTRGHSAAETPRWFERPAVTVALTLVLVWNLGEAGATYVSGTDDVPLNTSWLGEATRGLGLEQRWAMFAPNPQTEDGVFLVEGDGRQLLPALLEHPTDPGEVQPLRADQRWLLVFLELQARPDSPQLLRGLSLYSCQVAARTQPVKTVVIRYEHFEHLRDGTSSAVESSELWRQACPAP